MKNHLLFIAITGLLAGCDTHDGTIVPVNLRTEFLSNPLGLDTDAPRFTWEYSGNDTLFVPDRAEIEIGTSPDKLVPYDSSFDWQPYTRYYWRVKVKDRQNKVSQTSETASFELAKLPDTSWKAQWITDAHDREFEPAPQFRKSFPIDKEIKEARAYISAAGYYELFINGQRVGKNVLDPGYTHFDKRNLYVTHDVTRLLQQGENAIAAVVGNGWYNEQSVAVWNFHQARWRNRPRLLCEVRIKYTDGTESVIATDGNWKTTSAAYTYNNLYSGDRFDARLETTGWKNAGYDDSAWKQAVTAEAPSPLLDAQTMPGIQVVEEIAPSGFRKFSDRLYVYTFPKNIAGFCRLKVKGKTGTHITLKHGELLKADGRLEQGNINVYYHPEKPGEVFQTDEFTLKGENREETFTPAFTYHGFQYVEVESSEPIELTAESLTGLFAHTHIQPVGQFSCSNPLFNKIWNATMQAYRCNLHSIPTDCPQREKNGWTADAHVAIDLGLLGFDGITFYEKWMNDIVDNQREAGDISGIIPSSGWGYGEFPGPVWDAVMFIIPNTLYNYYGTTRSIETLYPTMERYLEYLKTKEKDGYLTFGLGDWVYWKATTNTEYTSTAYYYLDNLLMARFARLLGKDATPYQQKAEELKNLINLKFFQEETGIYAEGTQTAQAVALYLGLVPDGKEKLVAEKLHETVAQNNYFLDFGLLGSKTVPAMLTRYGYIDDVMRMVSKTEAPSWGYWVETKGYTTLPETWTLSPEFRDASLNHVFMGDISAWMMNQLAGINLDENNPGFRHIRFTPHFVQDLDWAEGSYHSPAGEIRSKWERNPEGKIVVNLSVPLGSTAELKIGDKITPLTAGKHQLIIDEE